LRSTANLQRFAFSREFRMNHPSKPIKIDPEPSAPQPSQVPLIKVDDSRSRAAKKPKSKPQASRSPAKPAFDAAALGRLVGPGPQSSDSAADPPTNSPVRLPTDTPTDSPAATPIDSSTDAKQSTETPAAQPSSAVSNAPAEAKSGEATAAEAEPLAATVEKTPPTEPATDTAPPAESVKPVAVQIQTTKPGVTKSEHGKRDSAKVQPATPAAAQRRTAKQGARKAAATGGAGAKRVPTHWIVLGVCGGSALGLMILLFSLLGGPSADSPSRPGERSASAPVTGSRTLPTFPSDLPTNRSDLPTFQSDLPTNRSGGGVRPMSAAEKASRQERIASFAEMAREEEAALRKDKPQPKP
jgi:hypothetical protein